MTTFLYSHLDCLSHNVGDSHPECPDRLRSVLNGLEEDKFNTLVRKEAPKADVNQIEAVHRGYYIEKLMDTFPETGYVYLDPDTALSAGSLGAALRASGAAIDAVDAVIDGKARNAFCAVRPPGHHAESNQAMGFCLLNSAAIAAVHARSKHQMKRVAVVDFDVHHGNGTQHTFETDSGLFYASSHQWPAYPGTGLKTETGVDGNIVNVPLSPGSGSSEFRKAYTEIIVPALRSFNPEIMIISAGFDAHIQDPLAQLNVKTEDYGWLTEELIDVAKCCDGRIVSLLEGGYDLKALRESVQAHVSVLLKA
ncbi:MAG: acetoin utilization protein [Rhodospirillaceae bacterium TMED8]|nr:acetoin utilization protein [Magnetovibrio sp.]OUT50899.1 MAG: acetoin utilization protein [Rhodospirillaceae bacterium TMED8]